MSSHMSSPWWKNVNIIFSSVKDQLDNGENYSGFQVIIAL